MTFQFYRLAHTPGGLFVLLDYLNFKGEGIAVQKKRQGWGLLQVLQEMRGMEPGAPAVDEFVESAKRILTRRVKNAPEERGEERWLKGWHNRIEGYRKFSRMLDKDA